MNDAAPIAIARDAMSPQQLILGLKRLEDMAADLEPGTKGYEVVEKLLHDEMSRLEALLWAGPAADRDVVAWRLRAIAYLVEAFVIEDDIPGMIARVIADLSKLLPTTRSVAA